MTIGAYLDRTVQLSWNDHLEMAREATGLGYSSLWFGESRDYDAFLLSARRWEESNSVKPGGIIVGTAVTPVIFRSPMALALGASTLSSWTGGRFVLGVSSSALHQPSTRAAYGLPNYSPRSLMHDYLTILRALFEGETVNYEGKAQTLRGYRLNVESIPRIPLFLGALGPELLRVGGELADGVIINWCTPEHAAWVRERIAEGATHAGRDPGEVKLAAIMGVCVDEDDADQARLGLARALIRGPLMAASSAAPNQAAGYRGHFERMGFGPAIAKLDELRGRQAPEPELLDAFPPEQLQRIGYFGNAAGAREAVDRWASHVDIPIIAIVATKPGLAPVMRALQACSLVPNNG